MTDEQKDLAETIRALKDPDDIIKWMRKPPGCAYNKRLFRTKMIEQEKEVTDGIKEKSLKSLGDIFIENALYFFLHTEENHASWIYENLDNFRSPYAMSMYCLVIGFRGDISMIDGMMEKADHFARYYPDETYDQGPIFAVSELGSRFLGI